MTGTAIVAAALGIVVGTVIGGLGGGGGVLAVPALVYVLGQSAHDATTGGVLIVGVTALVGAVARIRERGVEWRTGIAFGAVGIPAAFLGTLLEPPCWPAGAADRLRLPDVARGRRDAVARR